MQSTRIVVMLALLAAVSAGAIPFDIGNTPPAKTPSGATMPPPDPDLLRQGGADFETALVIADLPFTDTGTTAGYADIVDEACPYDAPDTPDVFYAYVADRELYVSIDLCGSGYDTKTFVYSNPDRELLACNDDHYNDPECGQYTSLIQGLHLDAGESIWIVVSGWDGDFGPYELEVREFHPYTVACPEGAALEGEPPLDPGYWDEYNNGCYPDPENPRMTPLICGDDGTLFMCCVSGWADLDSTTWRDTDHFETQLGPTGIMHVTIDAEFDTYMTQRAPTDCEEVGVVQVVLAGPEVGPATMTVRGSPGETVWLWAGASTYHLPEIHMDNEYDYLLIIDGGAVATQRKSLGGVRSMFR